MQNFECKPNFGFKFVKFIEFAKRRHAIGHLIFIPEIYNFTGLMPEPTKINQSKMIKSNFTKNENPV